jgi:hypothetical protein
MSKMLPIRFVAVCAFLAMASVANAQMYTAHLTGSQEVPQAATTATGYGRVMIDEGAGTLTFTVVYSGLSSNQTLAHIHAPAPIGANTGVAIDFGTVGGTSGTISGTRAVTSDQIAQIRAGLAYINVHSVNFPGGELRGQLGLRRVLDFDGDGQTDYSVLRFPNVAPPGQAPITQYNLNSTTGFQAVGWGDANTDFPCAGDYDGDGQDDLCVYRAGASPGAPSYFYILHTSDLSVRVVEWGVQGDQAVARDYDGDGKTDLAIYRRGAASGDQAYWWIIESRSGLVRVAGWGLTGTVDARDYPAPQDYDGDGKVDLAIYRVGISPANTYIVLRSSDSTVQFANWGNFSSDWVIPGDFDGDGKADFTAGRTGALSTSPLVWWTRMSSNGTTRVQTWGQSADRPAPGDYDGDGRTDITVTRDAAVSTGPKTFWSYGSFANAVILRQWGLAADYMVAQFSVY